MAVDLPPRAGEPQIVRAAPRDDGVVGGSERAVIPPVCRRGNVASGYHGVYDAPVAGKRRRSPDAEVHVDLAGHIRHASIHEDVLSVEGLAPLRGGRRRTPDRARHETRTIPVSPRRGPSPPQWLSGVETRGRRRSRPTAPWHLDLKDVIA